MKNAVLVLMALSFGSAAQAQSPQPEFTDPVALLKAVAKNYAAAADTFHIESISVRTHNSDLRREWDKTYQTAIKGPGSLYRIETRSSWGSYIQISDGINEWLYLVELKSYVKRPLPQDWPHFPKMMAPGMVEVRQAWDMRMFLEANAGQYKRATMLPAETIAIEGHEFPCYVVHVTSDDSTAGNKNYRWDTTFWVDKNVLVFRKQVDHTDGYTMLAKNLRLPDHSDTTTVYPVTDFHPHDPPETFRFTPPADTKEVASLDPDYGPMPPAMQSSPQLVGQAAPDVSFTTADGKKIALSSYKGKPLLIDVWATWCGPCLISMPALNRIYAETKDKGLIILSFDQDRDPEGAADYLARHKYGWTNYHDESKVVQHAFQSPGIPLTVLIDAQGKIVFDDLGSDEAGLRKAIASLGPEFSSVAPPDGDKPSASEH